MWVVRTASHTHTRTRSYFTFTGRFLAKALLDNQIVPAHLALPVYKHLLGMPISLRDVEVVDKDVHKQLLWLRANTGVEVCDLDFTVARAGAAGVVVSAGVRGVKGPGVCVSEWRGWLTPWSVGRSMSSSRVDPTSPSRTQTRRWVPRVRAR